MPSLTYPLFEFNERRQFEHWTRIAQINGDFGAFLTFIDDASNADHQRFGSYAMGQVKEFRPEVEKQVGSVRGPGTFLIHLDQADSQFFISLSKRLDSVVYVWSCWNSEESRRAHEPVLRRTKGIVTDSASSDPRMEADVIMTAAALGFAADYIATSKKPLQFDMDPLDADDPREQTKTALFKATVSKMDGAVNAYMNRKGLTPSGVRSGLSPGYSRGAMIMGVYALAGQKAPDLESEAAGSPLQAPVLSEKGRQLWDTIRTVPPGLQQYTGRGAYTGFVDNKNTVGDTDPVGPRSTVRMVAPARNGAAGTAAAWPRWMPPEDHALWQPRHRKGANTRVAWGVIGGDKAAQDPTPGTPTDASNLADEIESDMRDKYGMIFTAAPGTGDIAAYTHGMIQAIYKAYTLGPSCAPYEIAVGDLTKKMASCLPCTLFMSAAGYSPTSIHLGSGESWAPLYAPYNPNGPTEPNEPGVVRDLNNRWYEQCLGWLKIGLEMLDDTHIAQDHKASRDAVLAYLKTHEEEPTIGGVLILDAVTIHEPEVNRINRTLQQQRAI